MNLRNIWFINRCSLKCYLFETKGYDLLKCVYKLLRKKGIF
jgi:hypothetical protein